MSTVNDDILTDPKEGAAPPPPPAKAPEVVTVDKLQEAMSPMGRALETLALQVAQLARSQPATAPAAKDDDGGTDEGMTKDFKEFLDMGPQAWLKKYGSNGGADRMAAYLQILMEQAGNDAVANERTSIDAEFGAGTFDEFFRKDVEQALLAVPEENRAAARASKPYVKALVSGTLGELQRNRDARTKLEERRSKVDKERQEQEEAGLLGPGRGRPLNRTSVDPEVRDMVARLQAKGLDYSIEEWQKDRETGNSFTNWQARLAKENKK